MSLDNTNRVAVQYYYMYMYFKLELFKSEIRYFQPVLRDTGMSWTLSFSAFVWRKLNKQFVFTT